MIELPIWLVILYCVMFVLTTIYLCISDFFAKLFYRKLEEKPKPHKFYTSPKGTFDLTEMFGEGNEPTPEEFNKMFPQDYFEYDTKKTDTRRDR